MKQNMIDHEKAVYLQGLWEVIDKNAKQSFDVKYCRGNNIYECYC